MTAPTQPPHAPSSRRRLGWRSSLAFAAILTAGTIPLLVGAMRLRPKDADPPQTPQKVAPAAPSALIQMKRHAPRVMDDPARRESEADFATFRRTEVTRISGDAILRQALKRPEVKRLRCVAGKDHPLAWVRSCLEVEALPESELVRVSFRGDDAESAVIANAVAEQYVADYCEQERRERADRLTALESRLASCREAQVNVGNALEKVQQARGGQGGFEIDDLRQEIAAHEETKRWLRRELERQRLECRAADRVRVMERACVKEK